MLAVVSAASILSTPCAANDFNERVRLAIAGAASSDPALADAARKADVVAPAAARGAPVRTASFEDGANEPSGVADPKLAGEYALVNISKRRSHYVETRRYCPDFVKVVIHDPVKSVSVYGKMKDGSGHPDQPDQPGYFYLQGFTAQHWTSDDEYDEVQGRTRDTVFNGRYISETESGFMLMIGGFVLDSTVLRLGYFDSDTLVLKHTESATALLVIPVGTLIGQENDYACEYKRVAP